MIIFGFLPFSKPPQGAKFSTILSGRFCQCHLPRTFSIIKQRRLSPIDSIEYSPLSRLFSFSVVYVWFIQYLYVYTAEGELNSELNLVGSIMLASF